jgi:hypothetical protein
VANDLPLGLPAQRPPSGLRIRTWLHPGAHAQHHTYRDYLSWPDDLRYELVDGVAYLMSPAPSLLHQRIVVELSYQ